MQSKQIAVLGLGDFGMSVAKSLASQGCQVLCVDSHEENVQEISEYVTQVVKGDIADADMLRTLGLEDMDAVVIGIGNNLEASIMATIVAKEAGVPFILAKVNTEIQETVLKKIGVDQTLFVEKAMGTRVAKNLTSGRVSDTIELSERFSMVEIGVPSAWVGKTLRELNLRGKYGFNIIAQKKAGELDVTPNPDRPIEKDAQFILVGENKQLQKLM